MSWIKTLLVVFAVVSVSVLGQGSVRADIIVDDFNDVSSFSRNLAGAGTMNFVRPNVVGGNRNELINLSVTNPPLGASLTTNPVPIPTLNFSSDAGVVSHYELRYDGTANPADLGFALNLDLSDGIAFTFQARADNTVPGFVQLFANNGAQNATVPFTIPGLPVGTFANFALPLSSFVGINLGDVDAILVRIGPGGGTEVDGQFRNITITTQQVPEPGTVLLVVAGLAGLTGSRVWRRRKSAE